MDTNMIFLLFILFGFKHLWIDFLWQVPYEWQNKGTYGHFGGIQHSGKHAWVTMLMLVVVLWIMGFTTTIPIILLVSGVEFLVHYHMDWAKVNINKKYGWTATTHNEFWWMVGLDQFVHFLNYVWIIWMVI